MRVRSDYDLPTTFSRAGPGESPYGEALVAALVLRTIDFGIALLDQDQQLVWANPIARHQMNAGDPFNLSDNRLVCAARSDQTRWTKALARIAGGVQQNASLILGAARHPIELASANDNCRPPCCQTLVAVMFGAQGLSSPARRRGFAARYELTRAETRVLDGLGRQLPADQIALHTGVALSTIRSHVRSIYGKCGVTRMSELLGLLAAQPLSQLHDSH